MNPNIVIETLKGKKGRMRLKSVHEWVRLKTMQICDYQSLDDL